MAVTIFFVALGYLSGSVLYANLFARILGKKDIYLKSPDQNPGTANAYIYGGFWCGTLTLVCDLAKGFLPVFLYIRSPLPTASWGLPLVLAAPVIGHIFPVFYRFNGGKGIAATFGCLLGLFPYLRPFLILAGVFIILSLVFIIRPHYYRTLAAYMCAGAAMALFKVPAQVWLGFFAIAAAVILRLLTSKEQKERFEVKILWMH